MAENASEVIRERMKELGISQYLIGVKLGRSQGWVSQFLLKKPEATLQRLYNDNPRKVTIFLKLLKWDREDLEKKAGIVLTKKRRVVKPAAARRQKKQARPKLTDTMIREEAKKIFLDSGASDKEAASLGDLVINFGRSIAMYTLELMKTRNAS